MISKRIALALLASAASFFIQHTLAETSFAQNRNFGARTFTMDDGAGHFFTMQAPAGMTGNVTYNMPLPPASNPPAGFVNVGTAGGQTLFWNSTNLDWEASNIITNNTNGNGVSVNITAPLIGAAASFTTLGASGLSTLAALTQVGVASINGSGAAGTTIGNAGAAVGIASSTWSISNAGAATFTAAGTGLTVSNGATIGTTLGVSGLSTLAALTQAGTTNLNTTGGATTNIGSGGSGAVNIGNATGNTVFTGGITTNPTTNVTNAGGDGETSGSLNWDVNSGGYAVSVLNTGGAINSDGLIAKTTGTAATNKIFTANSGGTDRFTVNGDGSIVAPGSFTGGAGSFTTLASTGNTTLGTGAGSINSFGNATGNNQINGVTTQTGVFNVNGTTFINNAVADNAFSTSIGSATNTGSIFANAGNVNINTLGGGNTTIGNTGTLTVNGATTFNNTVAHGANNVSGSNFTITGGAISATPISGSTGSFTTLAASTSETFSNLTNGSVPYIGVGGLLSQNNARFFWDNTNGILGVGASGGAFVTAGMRVYAAVNDPSAAHDAHQIIAAGADNTHMLEMGYNTTDNAAAIQSINQGAGATPLQLQPIGGNVGINKGATAPGFTLDINGTLNATGAASLTGGAAIASGATISGGLTVSSGGLSNTGGLTSAGATTLSALGIGVVHSSGAGLLSSSPVSLTTDVSGILPFANGGTGSAVQNFVDLTTVQTVGGNKTFTGTTTLGALTQAGVANINTTGSAATTIGNLNSLTTIGFQLQVTNSASIGSNLNVTGLTNTASLNVTGGSATITGMGNGVVHATGGTGFLASSQIVNADITPGTIQNTALQNSSITVTGGTGLGVVGSPVALGGTVTLSNTGVTSNVAGTGIGVSGATGAVTISNTGVLSYARAADVIYAAQLAATGAVSITPVLNAQTANTVFAGPGSGGPLAPTFRALVAADVPSLAASYIQNQTGSAQVGGFNVAGNGTIGGSLNSGGTTNLATGAGLTNNFGSGGTATNTFGNSATQNQFGYTSAINVFGGRGSAGTTQDVYGDSYGGTVNNEFGGGVGGNVNNSFGYSNSGTSTVSNTFGTSGAIPTAVTNDYGSTQGGATGTTTNTIGKAVAGSTVNTTIGGGAGTTNVAITGGSNWSVTAAGAITSASLNSGSGTIQTTGSVSAGTLNGAAAAALTQGSLNASVPITTYAGNVKLFTASTSVTLTGSASLISPNAVVIVTVKNTTPTMFSGYVSATASGTTTVTMSAAVDANTTLSYIIINP